MRTIVLPTLLASLIGVMFWKSTAWAQDKSRILSVTGEGSVTVETQVAVIQLGVWIDGKSAQEVQAKIAEQSNQVVEKLKTLEVQKLQTTGISLNPQYDYRDNKTILVGVQGQNTLRFEVPIDKAGFVLDQAVTAGATQIQSIQFQADEKDRLAAEQEALKQAVKRAQTQAEQVLGVLGLSSKEVDRIQVNSGGSMPQPLSLLENKVYRSDIAASTPVVGGEQVVTATVTLDIRY
jgi:uncharacterized protein YggE